MWNSGYDMEALLSRLRELRSSPDSELYMPVLVSAAKFDERVPEVERLAIVRRSIAATLSKNEPDTRALRAAIANEQAAYLKKPEKTMVLLASVSIMMKEVSRRRLLGEARAIFSKSVPSAFRSPSLRDLAALNQIPDHPDSYMKVRVVMPSRSVGDAVERGFISLDLVRGIWNYALGFRRYRLSFGGSPNKAFNRILLGPRFSVHSESGDVAGEGLGIIEGFQEVASVSTTRDVDFVLSRERVIREKLRYIPYRKEIERAFVRYVRALDEREQGSCFLALWGLIEMLTGTLDARYDTTVKRAASLFTPLEPRRSVLQHLRVYRNGMAHSGRETELGELLVAQAKGFVEELFNFHLAQGRFFASFDEACQFLDFPEDNDRLRRQIRLRKRALFLRERSLRKRSGGVS
jgi:hypothetical protein